jgi:hypothetical protein
MIFLPGLCTKVGRNQLTGLSKQFGGLNVVALLVSDLGKPAQASGGVLSRAHIGGDGNAFGQQSLGILGGQAFELELSQPEQATSNAATIADATESW